MTEQRRRWYISRGDCADGAGRSVPDLLAPGLRVLLVGINPSNCSGAAGFHFATPGNRLWPTLHGAGFTTRQLRPDDRDELLALGIGITNLVNRASAKASEVDDDELRAGGIRLRATVREYRPRTVAVLGKRAFRTALGVHDAEFGRQREALEGAPTWLLPNPSGLNAHYQLPDLVWSFAELRVEAFAG